MVTKFRKFKENSNNFLEEETKVPSRFEESILIGYIKVKMK
jgi:hypothetical protein